MKYNPSVQALHWLMAAGLIYLLFFGNFEHVPAEVAAADMRWHAGIGLLVFILAALRLYLIQSQKALPELAGPPWQKKAHKWAHRTFYILFFALPVTGIILGAVTTYPVMAFGFINISALATNSQATMNILRSVHGFLGDIMKILLFLHIGAIFYHFYFHQNKIIKRIVPWG